MEMTWRELVTMAHGLLFGGFFLMAIFGALVVMWRVGHHHEATALTERGYRLEKAYLIVLAVLGWAAVLSGTYVVYPWYRAVAPPGETNLMLYPKQLLLAHRSTAAWHTLGMEWKEHVAWLAPIAITMVAYVWVRYKGRLHEHQQVRTAVLWFAMSALLAAGVAGTFGAMINKYAPVRGGGVLQLTGASR